MSFNVWKALVKDSHKFWLSEQFQLDVTALEFVILPFFSVIDRYDFEMTEKNFSNIGQNL